MHAHVLVHVEKYMHDMVHVYIQCMCTYSEKWSNIHIESKISESSSDDLVPTIMAVLPHLGHQDPGTPPFLLLKVLQFLQILLSSFHPFLIVNTVYTHVHCTCIHVHVLSYSLRAG